MWFLASLIAEFVFEVMTNDVQDDGVCGNDAGAAFDSNLIVMNHKGFSNRGKLFCFVFSFFKIHFEYTYFTQRVQAKLFYFTFSSPLSF